MTEFVELDSETLFINLDNVTRVTRTNSRTAVFFVGSSDPFFINAEPEELLKGKLNRA